MNRTFFIVWNRIRFKTQNKVVDQIIYETKILCQIRIHLIIFFNKKITEDEYEFKNYNKPFFFSEGRGALFTNIRDFL